MATDDDTKPDSDVKPLFWIASSRRDLRTFPKDVRSVFGQALYDAQMGGKHPDAKPLKGFGGSGVLEIVDDHDGNTYRAVYTVRFAGVVYVLHAFQKKSKAGIKTPPEELEKVRSRLRDAERDYADWSEEQKRQGEGRR
ncbi:MAG: type II toxin-antitoxin system RelE/ParE family toxin [Planctomycetales bacterium]